MSLYRTVSDRGLWKKNQRNQDPKPQHFHKPQYIDKESPAVTYSRLSLGEGYRYNSRQSIPDINRDIEAANNRFDQVYSSAGSYGRNFKSCPTTPRATTPTRNLSRSIKTGLGQESDIDQSDYISSDAVISRSTYSRGSYNPTPSPYNTGSIYGQTFTEDDRYSFESRSLTAYSNYSERESIIDSNYRYPYAREPTYNYQEPRYSERENPFLPKTNANYNPNDVVNLFLQKSFFSNVTNNNNNFGDNNRSGVGSNGVKPSYYSNSTVSPVSDTTSNTEQSSSTITSPGYTSTRAAIAQLKKEFLNKPPEKPVLRKPKANKYLQNRRSSGGGANIDDNTADTSSSSAAPTVPSPEVVPIVQLEREPVVVGSAAAVVADPDPNLVTKPSIVTCNDNNRSVVPSPRPVTTPPVPTPDPDPARRCDTTVKTGMESFFLSDTVKSEDRPKLHHAEICSVRKETSSDCSSMTSSEDDLDSSRNIMVSINPTMNNVTNLQTNLSQVKLEAPPQRQNIWGPSPRHSQQHDYLEIQQLSSPGFSSAMEDPIFSHSASTFYPKTFPNTEHPVEGGDQPRTEIGSGDVAAVSIRPTRSVSFENALDTETDVESDIVSRGCQRESEDDPILPERSFQDPAFSSFVDSQKEKQQGKQKKKGFLSSLFKKSNKRQQPYGDDYIHIERKVDIGDTSESEVDTKMQELMDQSPRFHILKDDSGSVSDNHIPETSLAVPMPGSPAARQLFPATGEHVTENSEELQHGSTIVQKIPEINPLPAINNTFSGTRTDFNEDLSLNNHSSMDYSLPQLKPTSLDDILDDFNNKSMEVSSPVISEQVRFIPEHERTQEIDIDALLALPDTPEETEEDLEAEENGQFSFSSSTQQTCFQRDFREADQKVDLEQVNHQENIISNSEEINYIVEQKLLEQEQRYLTDHNLVLEKQLMDKENERLSVMKDNSVLTSEVLTEDADNVADSENVVTNEQVRRPSFRERKKPKSIFNFDSFRKPKNKNQSNQKLILVDTQKTQDKTDSQNIVVDLPNENENCPEEIEPEEDLATKIVREIQKSTVELNLKPAQDEKPSFFNATSLRKSVRGFNNKNSNPKVQNSDESNNLEQKNAVSTNNEDMKKEKKPSLFNLRSSSRDRKRQSRPLSAGDALTKPETADGSYENKIEAKPLDKKGFGNIFSSNKQRSRSQERSKRIPTSESFDDSKRIDPNLQINDHKHTNTEDTIDNEAVEVKSVKQETKTKGFSLFGSSRQKTERTQRSLNKTPSFSNGNGGDKNPRLTNITRPQELPPLPPAPVKSGLSDFFANQATSPSSPSDQIIAEDIQEYRDANIPTMKQPSSSKPLSEDTQRTSLQENDRSNTTSDALSHRKSAFLQSTLLENPDDHIPAIIQTPDPRPTKPPTPNLLNESKPHNQTITSLNSSFSEDQGKFRQTGRQSGRFRKNSPGTTLHGGQQLQRPTSSLSQSPAANPGQTVMMDNLIIDSMSRPTTPHHPNQYLQQTVTPNNPHAPDNRRKVSSISRTESYRKARGTEEERPKVVKKSSTYNSLPRQQGRNLRRGNSEDSLRNALDNEQQAAMPRSKSRQEKKGDCSVM